MEAAWILKLLSEEPPESNPIPAEPPDPRVWTPLSRFHQEEMPVAIWLPSGQVEPVDHWIDLLKAVANWAALQNLILPRDCPVILGNPQVPIIGTEAPAREPRQTYKHIAIDGGLHLYVKFNRQEIRDNCRNLLMKIGVTPDLFHVRCVEATTPPGGTAPRREQTPAAGR